MKKIIVVILESVLPIAFPMQNTLNLNIHLLFSYAEPRFHFLI
jgi:hypothetical protein